MVPPTADSSRPTRRPTPMVRKSHSLHCHYSWSHPPWDPRPAGFRSRRCPLKRLLYLRLRRPRLRRSCLRRPRRLTRPIRRRHSTACPMAPLLIPQTTPMAHLPPRLQPLLPRPPSRFGRFPPSPVSGGDSLSSISSASSPVRMATRCCSFDNLSNSTPPSVRPCTLRCIRSIRSISRM